jgi:hypothetical protein
MHVFAIPERPRRIYRNGMGIDKEGKMMHEVHVGLGDGGPLFRKPGTSAALPYATQ